MSMLSAPPDDDEPIQVVVTKMIDGESIEKMFPKKATVGDVKATLSQDWGLRREYQRLYLDSEERERDLWNDTEPLRGMRRPSPENPIKLSLLMDEQDASLVVPGLSEHPTKVLGTGLFHTRSDASFNHPRGAAWVPAQPDWLITTEGTFDDFDSVVKVTNVRTGAMICKVGGKSGGGDCQFWVPMGVAITADSAYVIVADYGNDRLQVLRLMIDSDGKGARLEFVRPIEVDRFIRNVALLDSDDGTKQTILMTPTVSEYALDGTRIRRLFARISSANESNYSGYFIAEGITVLASGEVAIAKRSGFNESEGTPRGKHHKIQTFDRHGTSQRHFSFRHEGHLPPGDVSYGASLASDARGNILVTNRYIARDRRSGTGRVQLHVYNSMGEQLCTRALSGQGDSAPIAWGSHGQLAVVDPELSLVRVWY